jgi:hypothetical protein
LAQAVTQATVLRPAAQAVERVTLTQRADLQLLVKEMLVEIKALAAALVAAALELRASVA